MTPPQTPSTEARTRLAIDRVRAKVERMARHDSDAEWSLFLMDVERLIEAAEAADRVAGPLDVERRAGTLCASHLVRGPHARGASMTPDRPASPQTPPSIEELRAMTPAQFAEWMETSGFNAQIAAAQRRGQHSHLWLCSGGCELPIHDCRATLPSVEELAAAIDACWAQLLAPGGGKPDGLKRSAAAILEELARLRGSRR